MRRLLLSCSLAITALANAQISGTGAWVPGPADPGPGSKPMPYYFSGTNCRAEGWVQTSQADGGIQDIWLEINGEEVKHVWPDVHPLGASIGVTFDSTHFAPDSVVTVTVKAHDVANHLFTASNTAVVKNRALIYSQPFYANWGAGEVDFYLSNCYSYFDISRVDSGWTRASFFDDMTECSLLWVSAHGLVGFHESPNPTEPCRYLESINDPTYQSKRAQQIGSGLPPFNSTTNPPIALAWFDSCQAAGEYGNLNNISTSFNYSIWPWYTAYYPNICVDQACIGPRVFTYAGSEASARADYVYSKFTLGYTADYVRSTYLAKCDPSLNVGVPPYNHRCYEVNPHIVRNLRLLSPNGDFSPDYILLGDYFTRIVSVYTGDNSTYQTPQNWYRGL